MSKNNRGKQKKQSFVIYTDSLDILDNMSDTECGQLFRAIKAFQNSRQDELEKLLDNPFIKGIFLNFQAYFTRDYEKYENICKKRKDAALKSSEKKKQMVANASNCKQMQANGSKCPLDTDTDTDTDTDNDNDNEKGVWGKNAREETHPHPNSHWAIIEENDKCPWDDRYRRFNDWMKEKAEYCAKHMQRITPEQLRRVLDGKEDFDTGRTMTKDGLYRMIADIENKNDARGRYNNLWTTVRKFWMQEHKSQN